MTSQVLGITLNNCELLEFPSFLTIISNWFVDFSGFSTFDWGQKAFAAIGFIKATETLRKSLYSTKNVFKKPHNPLKSLHSSGSVFKKSRIFYKSLTLSLKMSHYWKKPPFLFEKTSDFWKSLGFFEKPRIF
jgi:hypothetical protein